jgi:hypothetical protein
MNKIVLWKKGLVMAIVFLFIGVGVYPAIAVTPKKTTNITQEKVFEQLVETDPKEYLFQTIIDIANNPDVNELLNQIEDQWKNGNCYMSWDFNSKSVFQKLLFNKPNLLYSILFTESSLTHQYLKSSYNRGCKVTNILGEENVIEIVESAEITNPEIYDELNNIIMNDEELYDKITMLAEMNEELDSNLPFKNYSRICKILLILFYVYLIRCGIVSFFSRFFEGLPIISVIFDLLWFKNWVFAGVCMLIFQVIYDILGCESPSPSYNTFIK